MKTKYKIIISGLILLLISSITLITIIVISSNNQPDIPVNLATKIAPTSTIYRAEFPTKIPTATEEVDEKNEILYKFYNLIREQKFEGAYEISSKNKSFETFKTNYENVENISVFGIEEVDKDTRLVKVEIDGNLFEATFKFNNENKIIWSEGKLINQTNEDSCLSCGDKPIIYLYPEKRQDIKVSLDFDGELLTTYPKLNSTFVGWDVIAEPNGTLINKDDGKEYSYLFWEGRFKDNMNFTLDSGFVVEGKDTSEFLQKKLSEIGLTPKEYNEFIVYWLPRMQNNKFNLIHFSTEEYQSVAKLDIEPIPDSILRVFMVFKPMDKRIDLPSQKFTTFTRDGFTVVEWGGTEVRSTEMRFDNYN